MSSDSASKLADVLPNSLRHAGAVGACIPSAVASTERYSTPALPPSSGWTQSISGQAPRQAVAIEAEPRQELRADGHRVDRRAVVVQQAGNDRLAGAGAAADLVGGFQDGDLDAGLGKGDRGGQAVRPGPHDNCGASRQRPVIVILLAADHRRASRDLAESDQVTSVGIGPLGSHGCSLTASVTFHVPRSITPSAASMTL